MKQKIIHIPMKVINQSNALYSQSYAKRRKRKRTIRKIKIVQFRSLCKISRLFFPTKNFCFFHVPSFTFRVIFFSFYLYLLIVLVFFRVPLSFLFFTSILWMFSTKQTFFHPLFQIENGG